MSTVTSPIIKDSTAQTIATKLDNINDTLGGNTNLAPIFNTSTAYSKGDMVNYNGDLYVFTANHAAGAWTGSDVVQTKVSTEISSLKSGLTSVPIIKTFEVNVSSGATSINFTNSKPADFLHTISACSRSGGGVVVSQLNDTYIYFSSSVSANAIMQITYIAST